MGWYFSGGVSWESEIEFFNVWGWGTGRGDLFDIGMQILRVEWVYSFLDGNPKLKT